MSFSDKNKSKNDQDDKNLEDLKNIENNNEENKILYEEMEKDIK